ncbi:MAG: replication restart helicase PriA [Bacilli bacterium]|jgi:primosomal protein N' (replication factor Y)
MLIIEVLIERTARSLDRPFSYLYKGKERIQPGIRVLIEFKQKKQVGYVLRVEKTPFNEEELTMKTGINYKFIDKIIDQTPLLSPELMTLATKVSDYYLTPQIQTLQTMLPPSLRPRLTALKGPKIAYEQHLLALEESEADLTPKQAEILRYIIANPMVKKRDLKSQFVVKALIDKSKIKVVKKEKSRFQLPEYPAAKKPTLTADQNRVIASFLAMEKNVALLEGVTGSGKTEVYLALAEHYLKQKKGVLMLVSEIALTPMMVAMFISRYGKKVAVLHSELTPAEKYDEYRKVASGHCPIVVGTRSAIFAPVKNLGLIILDEEHSDSYKQETPPTYHARTVAEFRSEIEGAKVLLGSATPSLESKARALKDVYQPLYLSMRINRQELPQTEIINMLDYQNIAGTSLVFSTPLLQELQRTLARKEQAILLINRRGYATYITCRKCGYVFRCPFDQTTLTYHLGENMLKCHHCDHREPMPDVCPSCGSQYIRKTGFGTELVDREINKLFPLAKTLRLDSDTAKDRAKIAKTVEAFRQGEADVLIGTQMIAKGHDFPKVTLVGIVSADLGLLVPSYKSSERTFQLLTQAVGRSGRADLSGKAFIQTNLPTHYAITLAAQQDYTKFFNRELIIRSYASDPPFTYLLKVTLKSKNEEVLQRVARQLYEDAKQKFPKMSILGPALPFIFYEREYHARYLLFKHVGQPEFKKQLAELLQPLIHRSNLQIIIDVDAEDI